MTWLADLDARIWQAVIAGLFLAFGWLVNGRQNRRAANRLREEKLRDAHRAIFAEIATYVSNLWDGDQLDDYAEGIVARMQADPEFVPFIPRERYDRLFENIQSEINILPRVTIDPVVRYYSILDAIAAIAEDMRGRRFALLDPGRRIAIYRDYIGMRKQAQETGRLANHLIAFYAEHGKEGAEAESLRLSRLNIQRAGPSDT